MVRILKSESILMLLQIKIGDYVMTVQTIMTRICYWNSASYCYMANCFINFSSVIGWYTYNKYTGRSNRDIISEEDACALIAWSLGD